MPPPSGGRSGWNLGRASGSAGAVAVVAPCAGSAGGCAGLAEPSVAAGRAGVSAIAGSVRVSSGARGPTGGRMGAPSGARSDSGVVAGSCGGAAAGAVCVSVTAGARTSAKACPSVRISSCFPSSESSYSSRPAEPLCATPEDTSRSRSDNATSSSIELECVFFSCTPNSGSRSSMTPGFTSSSRASSLILIFFIQTTAK